MTIKLTIKKIAAILKFIPILIEKLLECWDGLSEIYNEETMKELESLKKEKR